MKTWKKALLSTAILGTAAVALAACGSSKSSDGGSSSKTDGKTIRLYVDTEQKKAYDQVVADFEKENKDIKVEVKANNSGASNAKTDIAKDPAKYGDVFQVPHDQLGDMAEKGYINEIAPKYADASKSENSELAFNAVNYKGKTYALPYEEQSQFIYYDKTKLTADDVKSWETLTSKGVLGTNFAVPYNVYPIFFSAGTTLYGENGETLGDMSVDSDKGVNAMKWFAEQKSNKGVMNTDNTLNQLKSGK
ncbi:MAG: extracellular solute-binding protein, partial [Pseudolactococcus laudensis]